MGWENVSEKNKSLIEGKVDKLSKKILSSPVPHASLKTRFLFSIMRMLQKKDMGASQKEKNYWEEKGWLGKARPWK